MSWVKLPTAIAIMIASLTSVADIDVRGNVAAQVRIFTESAAFSEQERNYSSISIEPEFYWESSSRDDSFLLVPFARVDQHDDDRSHIDIREASWIHVSDAYEFRLGLRRVFWGKTEFQHLVDVINQIDAVEDIDAEDKLGQPMLNLSLVRDWGIIDFFIMPYFRERTFAGIEGRPRFPLQVDTDNALYQSDDKNKHIDYAARWAHYIDFFDFGISWFKGTGREPRLIPRGENNKPTVFIPFYEQIEQISFDGQATIASWLLKTELLYRKTLEESYWASQTGLEYTLYGIADSASDLGLLIEYGWDERGKQALSPFQNDLFTGGRLALNDVASSELLMGISYDVDYESYTLLVEGSRRFGNQLKILMDLRLFDSKEPSDLTYLFRQDDHLQITAEYYF